MKRKLWRKPFKKFENVPQTVINENASNQENKVKLTLVEQLKQNIKEDIFDNNRYLRAGLTCFEFYSSKIPLSFESCHFESFIKNKAEQILNSLSLQKDISEGLSTDMICQIKKKPDILCSLIGHLKEFYEKFKIHGDYYNAYAKIVTGHEKTGVCQNTITKYLSFCCCIYDNNQVFIDLLNIMKKWLSYMMSCEDSEIDDELQLKAREYMNIEIPFITFTSINDYLKEALQSKKYKDIYGDVIIYLYISGNQINIGISHELQDPDKTIMMERLNSNNFDVTIFDLLDIERNNGTYCAYYHNELYSWSQTI